MVAVLSCFSLLVVVASSAYIMFPEAFSDRNTHATLSAGLTAAPADAAAAAVAAAADGATTATASGGTTGAATAAAAGPVAAAFVATDAPGTDADEGDHGDVVVVLRHNVHTLLLERHVVVSQVSRTALLDAARVRFGEPTLSRVLAVDGRELLDTEAIRTAVLQHNAPAATLPLVVLRDDERYMIPAQYVGERRRVLLADQQRVVTLTVLSVEPRIFQVDNFIHADECDHVVQRTTEGDLKEKLIESLVGGETARSFKSATRNSRQIWVGPSQHNSDEVFAALQQRVSAFTHMPLDLFEDVQVVHYNSGEHYFTHHDYTMKGALVGNPYYEAGGNRLLTMLFYLNDVEHGGETIFPYVNSSVDAKKMGWQDLSSAATCNMEGGLRVAPRRGRAVLFYNLLEQQHMDGVGDEKTLHAGCDPLHGAKKYLCNVWVRQKRVRYVDEEGNVKHILFDKVW